MTETRTSALIAETDALLEALGGLENPPLPPAPPARGQGHLSRRAQAAYRLPVLACGCHDPASYQHRYGVCRAAA